MSKIVLIVPRFPVLSETFIANKFSGLIKEGLDLFVVCQKFETREWEKFPALAANPGYKERVRQNFPTEPKWIAALLFPFVLIKVIVSAPLETFHYVCEGFKIFGVLVFKHLYLDAQLVLLKPDAVHFEFGALAVKKTYLKKVLKCKLAVSFRGYDVNFSGLENEHYYDQVWKEADLTHFLGKGLWSKAVKRGCPPEKKRVLIPPSIDTDFFCLPGRRVDRPQKNKIRILSVGRLTWEKGHEFSMQALKIIKERGLEFEFRLAGAGPYLEALSFCRHQLGLEAEVIFLGAKKSVEIKKELEEADVFLHAAVSEGFCNAVLEAQAMTLPVVCSDAAGLVENVEAGVTGFIVPRRDPQAMAQKIELLARDPGLRESMGEKGRARVLANFQLKDQLLKFKKFYAELLETE